MNVKKRYQLSLLFAAVFCTCALAQNPVPAVAQQGPMAVTGATLHVGDGSVVENATILVRNGKIESVATAGEVPTGYQTVDATGKEVYPGLIALNSQLGLVEFNSVRATRDDREVGLMNPNARALIAFNTDSQVIPTVRSRGVMLAQATPEGSRVSGTSSIMQLDGWNYEDAAVQANDGIHIHWPDRNDYNWQTGRLIPNERYDEQERELEAFLQQAVGYCGREDGDGERLLKFEAFCDVVGGAAKAYLHANEARDIQAGVLLLKRIGANPVVVGGYQAHLIPEFLKREGVPVILGSTQALPASQDEPIDQPYRNPALLAEAGVEFAISHEGYWQQRNLPFIAGQAVGFGLDYEKAVEAITLTPARIAGIDDAYGSVEEGKSATFIVVAGDLLDMRTSQVEHAFIDGREVDLDNKQAELYRKFKEKYNRQTSR
ncbi:imidazolonepropionase-like amidohydrolase [Neolewinella xylanilytica]|uniref:Imidazolonepropionase-like amidohydrolase n=1 Tax=Neolewinella xylanilytica TaxID=1514080 RepID=A0A2S6I175_9BACT|nr:amidohydrolase family protein [Neolewinella xylanilytica]PPK84633.1 imidazolonepropionase-like amidohydrolase [Neolewinella xylanilytica]